MQFEKISHLCAYLHKLRDLNNQNTLVEIYNGSDIVLESSSPFCIEFKKDSKKRNYLFELWKGWRYLFLAKETAKRRMGEKSVEKIAGQQWNKGESISGLFSLAILRKCDFILKTMGVTKGVKAGGLYIISIEYFWQQYKGLMRIKSRGVADEMLCGPRT